MFMGLPSSYRLLQWDVSLPEARVHQHADFMTNLMTGETLL